MSEERKYTAQELRKQSDWFRYKAAWTPDNSFYVTEKMLRQAAEMRERLDELLLKFHSCPDERDLFNYILHGDVLND